MNHEIVEAGSNLGFIIGCVVAVLVLAIVIGVVMAALYKRATKEVSFVRTGLGGEKVVKDGGAIVVGMFHDTIEVNMNTLVLEVSRERDGALITQDRMRVDVRADFYLRVKPDAKGIATAAQTLGSRTMAPQELKKLMESKFVDVLRSVAAEMTMTQMHEQRAEFVQKVQVQVKADLEKNGLELESVSLTNFDQTALEFFNENNAFDAEGRAKLERIIQDKRKETNDIKQSTEVEIRQRDLEAEQQKLTIDKKKQEATLTQLQEIAEKTAAQTAAIKGKEEQSKLSQETARITREKGIEAADIEKVKFIKEAKIQQEKDIEVALQDKAIAIASKSEEENAAKAKAAEADKDRVEKEEGVTTAREVAVADRNKKVAVTIATQEAEVEAANITVSAAANKQAAKDEAEAIVAKATGKKDADILEAEGKEKLYEVDAKGQEALNKAKNSLSDEQVELQKKLAQIEQLPNVIAESVKPLLKIEGIKILQGYNGGGNSTNGSAMSSGGGLAEQMTNAALNYRAQVPLVDAMLQETGLVEKGLGLESLLAPTIAKADQDSPIVPDAPAQSDSPSTTESVQDTEHFQ